MTKTLFVHIGTGKTGSTAIQRYLSVRRSDFAEKGVYYWGLNLEHSGTKPQYSWQQPSGISILQSMREEQARKELTSSLEEALGLLKPGSFAVWSNESIYERPSVYIPLLRDIADRGLSEIRIVAYARGMKDYMLSAYKQWGVKHKTYPGRVLGFSDWTKTSIEFLSYGKKLNEWDQAFQNLIRIFNYDSVGDVIHHFVSMLPNCKSLVSKKSEARENSSPSDMQLALYALYNNQFDAQALPGTISLLLRKYKLSNRQFQLASLSSLYPSLGEISEAESLLKEDIDTMNQILVRHKQPPHNFQSEIDKVNCPTDQEVTSGALAILLSIIVEQELRISALEQLTSSKD